MRAELGLAAAAACLAALLLALHRRRPAGLARAN
ncbi:hypothetical protein ABH930_007092 [Kitasatospora sp. GAS204A]|nr:hypothetical protein [Kitasatospora sp. GAS204B]